MNWQFRDLVKTVYRLAPEGSALDAITSREMFQTAQWALGSEAAQSLAQMAARGATGNPALAVLARERQDLIAEWQKRDGLHNTWLGQAPDERNAKAEAENAARLAAIDTRRGEIDRTFKEKFPDYAALASPAPLSVEEVQAQVRTDEALVFFLDTKEWKPTPEETFIWVVTKTDLRWVRIDLGTAALTKEVRALRCGLDARGAWTNEFCEKLLGVKYTPADVIAGQLGLGKPLPFDTARAHALYRALFGQIEDLIGVKKHLLVVRSGPLTALPFQVLVTNKPDNVAAIPASYADYAKVKWLGQEKAITVLPAVASLTALRRDAKPSSAPNPYIAFANPLLSGKEGNDKRAWDKQACPERVELALSSATPPSSLRGLTSAEDVRHLDPLPETADEACAVARLLGADVTHDVYLGEKATKAQVKALSNGGVLAKARVVHFATHGLLAKETEDILNTASGKAQFVSLAANGLLTSDAKEPKTAPHPEAALVLTPPETASEEDEGLLTASDVVALNLDADWGGPIGLQHGGARSGDRDGGAVGVGTRLLLCGGACASGLALVCEQRRHRSAHHARLSRTRSEAQHRSGRGHAACHVVDHRRGRQESAPGQLGAFHRGRRRRRRTIGPLWRGGSGQLSHLPPRHALRAARARWAPRWREGDQHLCLRAGRAAASGSPPPARSGLRPAFIKVAAKQVS